MRKHTRKAQATLWLKITLNTLPHRTITNPTTLASKEHYQHPDIQMYRDNKKTCIPNVEKRVTWNSSTTRKKAEGKKYMVIRFPKYVPFRGCTPVYCAEFNQEWLIFNWFNIKKRECIFSVRQINQKSTEKDVFKKRASTTYKQKS